jgi:hypothetical protein
VCGHGIQTRKKRLKAKTTPARSAPAKPIPRLRASRWVPKAATNTLRTAMSPSDHQKGRR